MANSSLTRTNGTSTNQKIGTFSAWVKRSSIASGNGGIITAYIDSNNYTVIYFDGSSQLCYLEQQGGSTESFVRTSRLFRDTSAWYHIVVALDATQGTASNRVKIYVNGTQETDLNSTNYPSDTNLKILSNSAPLKLGQDTTGSPHYFNGYMSHVAFVDGQALTPTSFGETDSTSGIWKFKSPSGITWGTNGFHLKFENSGALGTDSSGNSNTFAIVGNLKQALDTPSNVYATLNPLNVPVSNQPTFSNGNTTSITNAGSGSYKWGGCTTLGMTSGKWYCEAKATVDNTYSRNVIGITGDSANLARTNGSILNTTHSWGYYSSNGGVAGNGSGELSGFNTTYTTGDIIMMALDLDNNKLYFGKNGTWVNSGVPTSGSTGTGAASIIAADTTNDGAYFFAQTDDTGTTSPSKFDFNFGNGFFGTTAITSAGSNGNGSLFEYDCPTGYYALNTKNINTYG